MDSNKLQSSTSGQSSAKRNGKRYSTQNWNPSNSVKPTGKTIGFISDTTIEQNIIKWIFKKYLHLCTRLGWSKNHIAKSTFKENSKSTQHKSRRVSLHLLERVEKELENLTEDKQLMRLE